MKLEHRLKPVCLRNISAGIFLLAICFIFINVQAPIVISLLAISVVIFFLSQGFFPRRVKLWELEAEMSRVENNLRELKNLVIYVSQVTGELMQTQGRFSGKEIEKSRNSLFKRLEDLLTQFGLTDLEITSATSRWHEWVKLDYVFAILGSGVPKNIKEPYPGAWRDSARKLKDFGTAPEALRSLYSSFGITDNPALMSRIDDYEFYITNHIHRNYDDWLQRESWAKDFQR